MQVFICFPSKYLRIICAILRIKLKNIDRVLGKQQQRSANHNNHNYTSRIIVTKFSTVYLFNQILPYTRTTRGHKGLFLISGVMI